MYVYHCAQLSFISQDRIVPTIFPLILQTIIIAQMMSSGGEVDFMLPNHPIKALKRTQSNDSTDWGQLFLTHLPSTESFRPTLQCQYPLY